MLYFDLVVLTKFSFLSNNKREKSELKSWTCNLGQSLNDVNLSNDTSTVLPISVWLKSLIIITKFGKVIKKKKKSESRVKLLFFEESKAFGTMVPLCTSKPVLQLIIYVWWMPEIFPLWELLVLKKRSKQIVTIQFNDNITSIGVKLYLVMDEPVDHYMKGLNPLKGSP